ncbi:MAG: hypothetical protein H0T79_02190 [Deltaproteobacteria bacterium]|nr:hypothetical protein [Deltaproteobacteria bacterium]
MRAVIAGVLFVIACGPKVNVAPISYDEDLPRERTADSSLVVEPPRAEAPRGKGERSGTIARARLVAVLDQGPGAFLRQLEVAPNMRGERFVGWQLVQFIDTAGPLVAVDLQPGDVLLAVNGRPLSRPDQLQTIWDGLRTADAVTAQLWRGPTKLTIEFAVEPKLATH